MSHEYVAELAALDRSHLLHVSTCNSIAGNEVTHALYRQPDGSTKMHVIDADEDGGGFVEILDRDEETAFMLAELEAWKPTERAC